MTARTIKVDLLARVEGEGALDLHVRNGKVTRAHLRIFEPPRLFEAMLRGRGFTEAPDITARICGICPVAYQMSSVHAMEDACGVRIDGPIRLLRRLLYCGEWIESHTLHVAMLHAPDFLGYPDAIQMARDHGDLVRRALALKKIGNGIMRLLGGREIHPVNVRVGGFYRVPRKAELLTLLEDLKQGRDNAVTLLRWVATFDFPDLEQDYEFVSLRHGSEYPLNEGRIISSRDVDIAAADFDTEFEERHVAHSTALHAVLKRRGAYLVGPMARLALNFDCLSPDLRGLAREVGLDLVCRNPFRSIMVRALEVVWACEEAMRLIEAYDMPDRPFEPMTPRPGVGFGCTEAPRGMLWHRYEIDAEGSIVDARIVPPTSQNQPSIEGDLRATAEKSLHLPDDGLRHLCEQTIRNYDPCISCSCHFLNLTVHRA
ncbi:MAG: Ni/Fe hydrogenase subunit alpha [Acetobacteraceae bacterium]